MPDEEDEAAFAEMLSMAEADPLAAIIMHHNVTAELVGVSDRVLLISREWDFIERVKLLGLGVAKSFLVGETSFAAAVAGLQTLMERLATLRLRFEDDWMVKKICAPIAEIHEFYRRPKSERKKILKATWTYLNGPDKDSEQYKSCLKVVNSTIEDILKKEVKHFI